MKLLRNITITLLLIFLLCACSREPLPEQNKAAPLVESNDPVQGSSSGEASHPSGFPMTDTPLTVDSCFPLTLTEEPENYIHRAIYTDVYGSTLYLLAHYMFQQEDDSYILYQFNADTTELTSVPFSFSLSQYESFYLYSMEVAADNTLSFRINAVSEGDTEEHAILYRAAATGHCISCNDIFPEEDYPWNPLYGTSLVYDSPQSDTLIVTWDNNTLSSTLSVRDSSTHRILSLCNLPGSCFSLCREDEEIIYYSNESYIIRYDLAKETGTCVASLSDCGLSSSGINSHMLLTSDGRLVLVLLKGNTPGIYFLAKETDISNEGSSEVTLRLADLRSFSGTSYDTNYGIQLAALLSTRSNTMDIQIEQSENTSMTDSFRDRIINELIAGKGPDMLLIDTSDLELFAEKDMLMDLAPILSPETKEALFPHVLELGTIDNTFLALPLDLMYTTMLVSDTVWPENSWTHEDLRGLMEDGQNRAYPILFFGRQITANELLFLLLDDHENSPFIDFQKGTCHFDNEEFIHLLELCKKYGAQTITSLDHLTSSDKKQMLATGEVITQNISIYNGFVEFSQLMEDYRGQFHMVGYPGKGTRANSSYYLVVNSQSPNLQAIQQYVDFLTCYENQYPLAHPLRNDVYENRLLPLSTNGTYHLPLTLDRSVMAIVPAKPNGESYLDDYLDFLNNTVAYRSSHPAINTILSEELKAYMNSNKSADEVTAIIQSRVQLYLDENIN